MTYILSFPPDHQWTLIAEPGLAWWLTSLASLFSMPPGTIPPGRVIRISSLLPGDPIRSPDCQVIGSIYGKIAINIRTGGIEVGVPDEGDKKPEYLSWITRALIIAIMRVMLPAGSLLLHAATLVRDGNAVLIAASSGGGKSTSAQRVPPPWTAPGDENALVVPDPAGGYRVHVLPTPSKITPGEKGLTWDVLQSYPLHAISILIQADNDRMFRCPLGEASGCLVSSAYQAIRNQESGMDPDLKRYMKVQMFECACGVAKSIPVFLLYATLNGRFWEEIERSGSGEVKSIQRDSGPRAPQAGIPGSS